MVEKNAQLAATPELLANAFDHEAAQEAAVSLGHAGKRVERMLARLSGCANDDPRHELLLTEAAVAVHHYLIQREIMGMRRHGGVIREYAIPKEVLVRLGASK